eukprot:g3758.t1
MASQGTAKALQEALEDQQLTQFLAGVHVDVEPRAAEYARMLREEGFTREILLSVQPSAEQLAWEGGVPLQAHRLLIAAHARAEAPDEQHLYEGYKSRLDAEASIAVVSALFASSALSMVDNMNDNVLASGPSFAMLPMLVPLMLSMRVVVLILVAGLNLFCVLVSSMVYFAGQRILSRSRHARAANLAKFKQFWDQPMVELIRRLSRELFVFSIPLFLFTSTAHPLLKLNRGLAVFCSALLVAIGIACVSCTNAILSHTGAQVGRTLNELLFGSRKKSKAS